jgi:Fe2+ or Zn2+ uptake regulation protein
MQLICILEILIKQKVYNIGMNISAPAKVQLKKVGLRVTPLRVALLDFFDKSSEPVDVQTCVVELTNQGLQFDLATIYRNLEHFENKGLLKKIDVRDGKYYYETADTCSHLICEKCGHVCHVHLDELKNLTEQITQKIAQSTHFKVKTPSTDFFGTCADCQVK